MEHGGSPHSGGLGQPWRALSLVNVVTVALSTVRVAVSPPIRHHGQRIEGAVGDRGGPVSLGAGGDQVCCTLSVVGRHAGQPGETLPTMIKQ